MALNNILARREQITTASGTVLAGGKVFLFEPGTTTFVTAFRDSGLVVPHTNPIRLSGSGRATVWITRDVDMFIVPRTNVSDLIPSNPVIEELNANPDALGADEAGGLVPNGSFEIDTDSNLVPDGYTLASEAGATNELDTSESTDGAQSFRFTSSGVGGGSLVTDDFFPVNDVDPLRVNVDLRSTVAAVRNIVRVEWYDVSQVSISNSDPYDSTANPAVFTTQNLAVVPPALARFAKIRLIGIDPSVALAGSTFFDRLSVFYPAIVSGVFDNITIQNNEIITTNLNGDLNLRPNGTGALVIDFNGVPSARSTASGLNLEGTLGNDPTAGGAQDAVLGLHNTAQQLAGQVGYKSGTADLFLTNRVHGGNVTLQGEDAGGTLRQIIIGDPDGPTDLFSQGLRRIRVTAAGAVFLQSDGNLDTESRNLQFTHQDGTLRGFVGFNGSNVLRLENRIHGADVVLSAEDAGGVARTILTGDPDSVTSIYENGNERLIVNQLGIIVRQNANVDTTDYRLRFQYQDATDRALVGFLGSDIFRVRNQVHGAVLALEGEDVGGGVITLWQGDPDGISSMYYNNVQRLDAADLGRVNVRSDGNTDTEQRGIRLMHQDGTERGFLGHISNADLNFINRVHGGLSRFFQEDAGGVVREFLRGTAAGGALLLDVGITVAQTITAAAGGLNVNNTLTGAGFERVLTTSDLGGNAGTFLIKAADEPVTSSTVLQNDDVFTWTVVQDTLYAVEGVIRVLADAAGDFKFQFTASGALGLKSGTYVATNETTGDIATGRIPEGNASITIPSDLLGDPIAISFSLIFLGFTSGGSETIDFQWAQGTSTGVSTIVTRGSWFRTTDLGVI